MVDEETFSFLLLRITNHFISENVNNFFEIIENIVLIDMFEWFSRNHNKNVNILIKFELITF